MNILIINYGVCLDFLKRILTYKNIIDKTYNMANVKCVIYAPDIDRKNIKYPAKYALITELSQIKGDEEAFCYWASSSLSNDQYQELQIFLQSLPKTVITFAINPKEKDLIVDYLIFTQYPKNYEELMYYYGTLGVQVSKHFFIPKVKNTYRKLTFGEIIEKINVSLDKSISFDKTNSQKQIFGLVSQLMCYYLTQKPNNKFAINFYHQLCQYEINYNMICPKVLFDKFQKIVYSIETSENKINCNFMDQRGLDGVHQSGWAVVTESLRGISDPYGMACDIFVDGTFHINRVLLEKLGIIPYRFAWIGFIHYTFDETFSSLNCNDLFRYPSFRESLKMCRGLICLSTYLTKQIQKYTEKLGLNFPVKMIHHPTTSIVNPFNLDISSAEELKIVQVGHWYRNPWSIYKLQTKFKKQLLIPMARPAKEWGILSYPETPMQKQEFFVFKDLCEHNFYFEKFGPGPEKWNLDLQTYRNENSYLQKILNWFHNKFSSVEHIESLPSEEYDRLLQKNIIFTDLIDLSGSNTIVECIMRGTPLLLRRHPAAIEYLGEEYPLFFDDLDQIDSILTYENINQATQTMIQRKNMFTFDMFIVNFKNCLKHFI